MTTDQVTTDVPRSNPIGHYPIRSAARTRFEFGVLDPASDPCWDGLVRLHPDFTVFHSAAWIRALSRTYGHRALVLYWCCDGEPAAVLPFLEVASPLTGRRGISLPFTDFCKPLFFTACDPSTLLGDLRTIAHRRSWKYFEIRGPLASKLPPQASLTFYGHSLDLRGGADALCANFAEPVRRAIRKADRSGLTVKFSTSEGTLHEFYRLHQRTRRRHGLPPQPLSFFRNIHRELIATGRGFIVLATHHSNPIAAAVFLHAERNAVFKFGASDERYQHLRPNNLVIWHAIRHLVAKGVSKLDLGRTSYGNEGLRRFKLNWGTVEEPIAYCRFSVSANAWITTTDKAAGVHNALFRRLPLSVNRVIGTMLYPHLD
jgi:CelD/BcsL family acetyltransferase involved in cellulose biosynthesis